MSFLILSALGLCLGAMPAAAQRLIAAPVRPAVPVVPVFAGPAASLRPSLAPVLSPALSLSAPALRPAAAVAPALALPAAAAVAAPAAVEVLAWPAVPSAEAAEAPREAASSFPALQSLRILGAAAARPAAGRNGAVLDGVFEGRRPRTLNGVSDPALPNDAAAQAARRVVAILVRHRGRLTPEAERDLLAVLGEAQAAGILRPAVAAMLFDPLVAQRLPPMDDARRLDYARRFADMLDAELTSGGFVPGKPGAEPWDAMARRHAALLDASAYAPRPAGAPSLLEEPGFIAELEALSGARFSGGNAVRPLIDGPASAAERERLMLGAKASIHLAAWAIYDDVSGERTADILIAKHRAGVKVRVMVDGQTALLHGGRTLARLEAAGIEVARWRDPARPYDGLHAKVLVVDGRAAVAGGMNVGDPYLHMDPRGQKWRDTDVVFEGPAALEAAAFFRSLWNRQAGVAPIAGEAAAVPGSGGARVSLVSAEPSGESRVLLAHLKAIRGATRRINIENAYFITFPALRDALLEALARGVEVNILTNSLESVDEPIVGVPILESLPELMRAGAKVWLKRGATLHSKFMTVDGVYAGIGSFNLHPRSVRYEVELLLQALGGALPGELDAVFARDQAEARRVERPADLAIPATPLNALVRRFMFNQL
ncbi:MAG: phosphatidylserine/phosphatidylglycerophosphate/cardiolipin synthase family protein [Elusimicrobia bacterium]|nr:phosphatidylserine/phosphatidylglycerophosphate/cardiolipin synthase family protein [Elusimicrobiota bacterium]